MRIYRIIVLLFWLVFFGGLAIAQDQNTPIGGEDAISEYGYYYKGRFLTLSPSKHFIAIEESGVNFAAFVKNNKLKRDSLSDREPLKKRSLGLYRSRVLKGEKEIGLVSLIKSFAEKTDKVVQPVFEQGMALLIPSDEVIVGFNEDTSLEQAQNYLGSYLNKKDIIELRAHRANTYILKIGNPSNGKIYQVSQFLSKLDKIDFAEPNHIVVMLDDINHFNKIDRIPKDDLIVIAEGGSTESKPSYSPGKSLLGSPSWTTLASLDFESSTFPQPGWTLGVFSGAPAATWGRTTFLSHIGSYSIYCALTGDDGVSPPGPAPINMKAFLQSPVIDLTPYEEVYVEVWFYAKNENSFDYSIVAVFDNDTGIGTGIALASACAEDMTTDPTTSNGWRKLLYRVPPAYRGANAFFAFIYTSDFSVQREGVYLDDIRIVATADVDTEPLGNDTYSARHYEMKNVGQIAGLGNDNNDMNISAAWSLGPVSPSVVVAVIDQGVDLGHPDLNLVQGYDHDGSVGGEARGSHGTACAGNVGAIADNSIGVMGTAPNVKIMPIYGGATYEDLASAIDVAVEKGAQVLSNSWGWVGAPSTDIEDAIKAALAAGRVVLFAAGNGPDRLPCTYEVAFPGNLTGTTDVICVGASSPTDEHKGAASSDGAFGWGSSYEGDGPDICAPSPWSYTTDIVGEEGYNDGSQIDPGYPSSADYTPTFGGTSSSTPKVAGVVALMLSKNPALTPAEVKAKLRNTADDIDAPGIDDKTGGGRVNAYKALGGDDLCDEDDTGALDIAGKSGAPNNVVTIPVRIENAPNGVVSFGFDLAYNTSVLEYVPGGEGIGWSRGDCVTNFDFVNVNEREPGLLAVGGFEAGPDVIPQGANCVVVELKFNVRECVPGNVYSLGDLQNLVDDIAGWSTSGACFQCGCSCDVNGDGEVTPQDALCAFQKYLGIDPTACGAAEDICCDVTLDDDCTPADALEIFKEYLGIRPNACSPE